MVLVLSVELAQRILFHSFLFSQGDGSLQSDLLEYVAGSQTDWRLDEATLPVLQEAMQKTCELFLDKSWHRPISAVREEVQSAAEMLCSYLQRSPRSERPMLLSDLMQQIVQRDYSYLVGKGGRPGRATTTSSPKSSPADPYFSYFVHYALLHRPTGLAEFDALFAKIGSAFAEQGEMLQWCLVKPASRRRMRMVLDVHNAHYPACPIALPAVLANCWPASPVRSQGDVYGE